jgi:hypothetical protein
MNSPNTSANNTGFLATLAEGLKQLQSLIPAFLAYISSAPKFPLFQFLNPTIAQDLWPVTSILSLIVSATNFNLARSSNKRTLALRLCFFGIIMATSSLLLMMAVVTKLIFVSDPSLRDYVVQASFIFFFIGVAFASGWAFSKILG